MPKAEWLTREQIDEVIGQISAADLIDAISEAADKPALMAGVAFDSAAKRLWNAANGQRATTQVRSTDFKYLADALGAAINLDSPLPAEISDSPASVDTGE